MRANGSIQDIDIIPQDIKELYKTVWELSMKDIIDMSRHRGYFIDQSQSLNLFLEGATMAKLTSMHFYAWKSGLKTGMYYLRTKSAVKVENRFTSSIPRYGRNTMLRAASEAIEIIQGPAAMIPA